jgi:hypothetical protein
VLENGLEQCNCKKKKCIRHGKCEECVVYQKTNSYHALPYCKRKADRVSDKANRNKESLT